MFLFNDVMLITKKMSKSSFKLRVYITFKPSIFVESGGVGVEFQVVAPERVVRESSLSIFPLLLCHLNFFFLLLFLSFGCWRRSRTRGRSGCWTYSAGWKKWDSARTEEEERERTEEEEEREKEEKEREEDVARTPPVATTMR